jgi:hypothetical protein
MKKILILLCMLALLCSCATTGKTESADGEAGTETADEAPAKKSTLYRDVDNAIKANCFLNPLACILSVPFRVIDAIEFIGDAVKDKDNASKEAEPKEGEK